MSVLTRAGESEISDYLVNRTEPGRPGSPPINLEASLVGRNNIEATWSPPLVPNSQIKFYEIRYGFRDSSGQRQETLTTEHGTAVWITNLAFYTTYRVDIRACTQLPGFGEAVCSMEWATIEVSTGIGSKLLR